MKKHLFHIIVCGLILLLAASPASALINFDEVSLGTNNPDIVDPDSGLTVNFYGGDSGLSKDVFTDDGLIISGNPYLASGSDPDSGYDYFIGAAAVGFSFETVTFDISSVAFPLNEEYPTTLNVAAISGGSVVDTMSLTVIDFAYHAMSLSFSAGFDSLHIWDDWDHLAFGDSFHIDNFAFTPSGGTPVPEPATILFLGTGLLGLTFLKRKKLKK